MKKKVVVGISGGVDSSVSAWLLKKNGYHVEGVFMKNWEENNCKYDCSIKQDLQDAQFLCEQIEQYWNNVFRVFLKEYQLGNTPNPDILCNKEIKFKAFLNFAHEEMQADYIATGHYVRRIDCKGKSCLFSGIDVNKDQRYHQGLMYYTIGQRKGLNIHNTHNTCSDPWYVADKDLKKNYLIAVQGRNHLALMSSTNMNISPLTAISPIEDANRIKEIELQTRHDIKSLEYFLKEKFSLLKSLKEKSEFIHFACTSEDINNLAYGLILSRAIKNFILPIWKKIIHEIYLFSKKYGTTPMLSRTHGQPATPSTFGKEMDIWIYTSKNYLKKQSTIQEIGSSIMPHKVNPIDFENSEAIQYDLNTHWEVLSEPIQIIMRRNKIKNSYELILNIN
uniref:Uncharacterized protein n=1 Tax=Glossina austeni TaxID=7395 RepID=A0A1A9UKK4_GLOAU